MISPDTKSYPYLAIARKYGVPYGNILKFSDFLLEKCSREDYDRFNYKCIKLSYECKQEIIQFQEQVKNDK